MCVCASPQGFILRGWPEVLRQGFTLFYSGYNAFKRAAHAEILTRRQGQSLASKS